MIELEVYFRESNAIEDVHDESAVEEMVDAWEYLSAQSTLSHDVLKGTHERLLRNRQPTIAGTYRTAQVMIDGELAPAATVIEPYLEELIDWTPADPLEAIEWHIAFEHLHPFPDGNGRTGRLVYLWHCRIQLEADPILWRAEDRDGYYALFDAEIDRFPDL